MQRPACEFLVPVIDHIEQTRADERAENDPRREIHDRFFGKILAGGAARGRPKACQKTDRGENAVPINGNAEYFESFWMHSAASMRSMARQSKGAGNQNLLPSVATKIGLIARGAEVAPAFGGFAEAAGFEVIEV